MLLQEPVRLFSEVPCSCHLTILVLHCQQEITTFLGIARM